jgi:prephenate dehydratase
MIFKNKLKPIISADTAGSAKFISEKKDKTDSAIASELAAKIYGLEIIKNKVEDEPGNVTRFFIMGKDTNHPENKEKKYITSCIFKLKSIPAALYKALGGFATNGVNLCKLESFSVKNTFDQVNFYIDIEGHIEDPSLQKALEELGFHTQKLDILGVYEAHKFRFENK